MTTQSGKFSRKKGLALGAREKSTLIRFIREWILPRRKAIVLALLFTAGLAAASGAYPLIIKNSFDTLLKGNAESLPWVLGAIIGVTMLRSLFTYLYQISTSQIIMRLSTDIQQACFAHIIHADMARLSRETTGQLVSRITNDIGYVQQATQTALISAIKDTLSAIAMIATMFYLDWMMATMVFGLYPLAIFPILSIGRRLKGVARRTQVELADMTSRLTETLAGARLIKMFRLEDYAVGRLDHSFEQIYALRMKAVRARARLGPALEALAGLAIAGAVFFAYLRITGGVKTVGDFMGFVAALLLVAQPLKSLSNVSTSVQEGLAAVERIYGLLDEEPTIRDKPGAVPLHLTAGGLAFDNVSFSYQGAQGRAAVRQFTLAVPGGRTAAFVGRSGAGKSTVINLVARMFDVDSGRILIDGQDVRDVTLASLREAIAIVSQDVTLFDDTIRANIALGRLGASEADIVAAAKAAAAHDFILAQPHGYDTQIGDSGLRLSGGQRQRLALARAILKDAPILLLDEATSALDTESERLVQEALTKFTRNRTTLVIAHRLSTVQRADIICVMEEGRIVETGTHAELLARDGIYTRLCRSQLLAGPEPVRASA